MKTDTEYMQNKKAQAVWMSWVLLVFLALVVGTIAGRYMIDKAQEDAENIHKYGLNKEECVNIALNVDFICKNSKALNMTLSNNGNLEIEKIIVKLYDTSGSSEVQEAKLRLMPGQAKEIEVPRGRSAYEVEITPVIASEGQILECRDYTITEIDIPDC